MKPILWEVKCPSCNRWFLTQTNPAQCVCEAVFDIDSTSWLVKEWSKEKMS